MKLFWKSYLVSAALVALSTALLTATLSGMAWRQQSSELQSDNRVLAVMAASQVEAGYHEQLWPFELLREMARQPAFVSWRIIDGAGRTVLTDDPHQGWPTYAATECDVAEPTLAAGHDAAGRPVPGKLVWIIPMRMRTGGVPWTFRLGFSTRSVAEHVRAVVLTNVLSAGTVGVLLLPVSLLLTRRVVRPVERLTAAVRRVAAGEWDAALPAAAGRDEIGQLVAAFGSMSAAVRQARDELEARVARRTASLARSNAEMAAVHRVALDCVLVMDADWRVTGFNPAAERTFGCARAAVIGRTLASFVAPSAGGDRFPIGQAIEVTATRCDGSAFPAELAMAAAVVDARTPGGAAVYIASLRDLTDRKRADADREALTAQLVAASRSAGMAEVATGVLHNVGNVLNSVNVSADVIREQVRPDRPANLSKAVALIDGHRADLAAYLTDDAKGRQLPAYLALLAKTMADEQAAVLGELDALTRGIEHIKQVVQLQQDAAKPSVVRERVRPAALLEDALRFNLISLDRHGITVVRDLAEGLPEVEIDKHKTLQILVNLISNAKNALKAAAGRPPVLTVRLAAAADVGGRPGVRFAVSDTGCGIAAGNLTRIFTHGFTTRSAGHGFGLHSAANAAREMGGSLAAASDGPDRGATFTLDIPLAMTATTPTTAPTGTEVAIP